VVGLYFNKYKRRNGMKTWNRVLLDLIAIITLAFVFFACDDGNGGGGTQATVSSVNIYPVTAIVEKGGTQQFTATVNGTNNPSQNVSWTIVQTDKHSGTTINTSGLLTVSASETLGTLTIRATSTADTSKRDTAMVTVTVGQPAQYWWTIIWKLDGGEKGTGTYSDQIEKGTVLARPAPDPTKTDYVFDGWYTDTALTQAYNFANPVITDLILYAKWVQPPAGINVSGSTLAEKLQWLQDNAQSNTGYTVEITTDEAISPHTFAYTGKSDITVTLWGRGGEKIISLAQNGSLFTVESGVILILANNITLQGRSSNNASLVMVSDGVLIMNTGAKISSNSLSSFDDTFGSGVYVASDGTFTMNGGEISGNGGATYGGGVFVWYGTFTMNGGEISGNSAYNGGGVCSGGTFTVENGKISGNTASSSYGGGGGVYVRQGTFTMEGGEISGNSASYSSNSSSGSGVYVASGGTFTMNNGEISGNTSSALNSSGGGVFVRGTFTMNDGEISGNRASNGTGGGVYVNSGAFTMNDGEISGNRASNGGGVYVSSGTFTMNGGEISGNTASNGGGVYVGGGTFRIVTGTVYGLDETNTSLRNTQALYKFIGGTVVPGSLSTTDSTIRVVNGELQQEGLVAQRGFRR
jgi:uncharacterized repeat protein (TIGR02543 family)